MGHRGPAGGLRRLRAAVAVAGVLTVLLGLAMSPAVAAPAGGGVASISNTAPQPGESLTVRASGLLAGTPAVVDYIPDGVRFGVFTVRADGTIEETVRIPASSYDGKKQIVVTSYDSTGHFTYLPSDLTIAGPPATVDINDTTLVPNQRISFGGDRWYAGSPYSIVLFPEKVVIASGTIAADRTLDVSAKMPAALLNGRHGFIVGGRAAGGKAAFFKIFATVTGGLGSVPDGDIFAGSDELLPTTTVASSTSTSSSSTTVTVPQQATGDLGGRGYGWLVVVILGILVLAALVITWFMSSDGRAWLRKRRERIEGRRRERMRNRALP